jgi:hypothetical protein
MRVWCQSELHQLLGFVVLEQVSVSQLGFEIFVSVKQNFMEVDLGLNELPVTLEAAVWLLRD